MGAIPPEFTPFTAAGSSELNIQEHHSARNTLFYFILVAQWILYVEKNIKKGIKELIFTFGT